MSTGQDINIQDCRELRALSEYGIIFVKVYFYKEKFLKILCATIFSRGIYALEREIEREREK